MDEISTYKEGSATDDLLRPLPNLSVVDRIIDRLTCALMSGSLQPGQKIPTEMELCASMQVGRNSVREAIKVLVSMGVLEIRRSEGTFVCTGFSNRMLDPMVYGLILEGGGSSKVIELRRIFDIGILQVVIDKANEQNIKDIRNALTSFQNVVSSTSDENAILEADVAFHKVLERTLNNTLVDKVSVVINRLTRPTRLRATRYFLQVGEREEICALHEKLMDIIERRDTASVATVMDEHFKYWRNELGD